MAGPTSVYTELAPSGSRTAVGQLFLDHGGYERYPCGCGSLAIITANLSNNWRWMMMIKLARRMVRGSLAGVSGIVLALAVSLGAASIANADEANAKMSAIPGLFI